VQARASPAFTSPARVFALCEKGRGQWRVRRRWTAPVLRARRCAMKAWGCPSPALHGTSWVSGRQIVVQPVVLAELLRTGDISSRTSRRKP
jgi:hypothetical protein